MKLGSSYVVGKVLGAMVGDSRIGYLKLFLEESLTVLVVKFLYALPRDIIRVMSDVKEESVGTRVR